MSKRVLASSLILLVFGGVLIPGGIFVNNYIKDLTYRSIDEGLLGIKKEAMEIIPQSVTDAGPKALLIGLERVKEEGVKASALLANTTIWMGHIAVLEILLSLFIPVDTNYWDMEESYIGSAVQNFSSFTYNSGLGFPVLQGISEWYGADLNFTMGELTWDFTGQENLKYGINTTGWWGNRLPGIFEDTHDRIGDGHTPDNPTESVNYVDLNQDRGFGIIELMELIENADDTQIQALAGPNGYNLTNPTDKFTYNSVDYNKLQILYFYLTDYFFTEGISTIIADFNTEGTKVYQMYPQYQPRDWNDNDTSYEDIAYYSLIEQWAKCTSYDNGADMHDSEPRVPAGTYGFEPGGPGNSSGIPMQAALQLWNETNEYSLLNLKGINKWYDAYTNTTIYNDLLAEFSQYPGYDYENGTYGESDWGFNETKMDLLLDWLWGNGGGWNQGSFFEHTLPKLVYDELAFEILLELWANGTVYGDELYPGGFALPLGFKDLYGFEIGYQGGGLPVIPTNMSLESALALWDETSEYSLVTKSGIDKWLAAVYGDFTAYTLLRAMNGLSIEAMDMILEWLPKFQQNVMPYLAQYQYSLPADSITLGNLVQVAGIGLGGVCLGLGGVALTGNVISRRKRLAKKQIGTIDKSKLEEKGDVQQKYL